MSRARRAALFALVGAVAAAVHVLLETPGAVRDWRQTLPLAAAVGAALGGLTPSVAGRRRGALLGLALAMVGMAGFALLFVASHSAISGFAGAAQAWGRTLSAFFGPTGLAALATAAFAGALSGQAESQARVRRHAPLS